MISCVRKLREPVNAISHMAGAIASTIGLTLLIVYSAIRADAWHVVSFSIFGTSLILMYTASFLYHGLKLSEETLLIFRRIDHMMIFAVIAGSYTPICLVPLRGPWGWSIFGTVWAIAIAGMGMKFFSMNIPRWISTLIYLLMGWLCLIAIYPIARSLSLASLFWLALGGFFYSAGAVIYAVKKPNPFPGQFGFHEIWHICVILGSASHFWLVFRHLMHSTPL